MFYGKIIVFHDKLIMTCVVELYDDFADNTTIETLGDNIVDFSQSNPFGEDNF